MDSLTEAKVALTEEVWAITPDDTKDDVILLAALKLVSGEADTDVVKKLFALARAEGLSVPDLSDEEVDLLALLMVE